MGWLSDLIGKVKARRVIPCRHTNQKTVKIYCLTDGGTSRPIHALKRCTDCNHRSVEQIASAYLYERCLGDYFFWFSRRLWIEEGQIYSPNTQQPTPPNQRGGGTKKTTRKKQVTPEFTRKQVPMRKRKLGLVEENTDDG